MNSRKRSFGGSIVILIVLIYMLGMMVHVPARAQEPEVVLYQENFDDGQAQGWELEPGWRVIQDGDNWVLAGEGHQWARPGYSYAGDFRVQFRLRLPQGRIHLVYRLNEAGRYFIGFDEGGSSLSRQYWPDTFLDGLAGSATPHLPRVWHQVEVVGQGARVRFLVDSKVEWEYTDPDPLLGGSFAFETLDGSVAYVDDILVYGPASAPTPTPTGLPQPQQVYLRAVEPPEGRPGKELELTLLGGGFGDADEVRVTIGEIEILDAWIESDEEIIAHVFIPEDAPPGPRPVEVVAVFGPDEEFPAGLEAGFFVLEREPMPPPFVDGVEPQQVWCGSQVELNVFGGNFLPEARAEIGGEGVLVHRVEFINAEHLRAFVEVWDDAPLGWREVIVINPDEQAGGHEHALEVIDGEGPPPPGRPALYEVAPREVEQGSEVELTLFGENFAEEAAVLIHGGGVKVRDFRFVDPSRLIVRVAVSADAEPGSRLVELNTAGGRAELPDGLIVIERGAPPAPPPPSPSLPNWVWAGATVLLSGLSFTVGRALALKSKLSWTEKARVQWRVEAENKLPEPKKVCQWACKVNVSTDLLDRWHVTTIELTPLRPSKGKAPPKRVEGNVLAPLNDLANIGRILQREDEVRRRLAPIVDALLTQIMAWEREGQTPAAIRVEAKLEAPINAQFKLYHCEQTKKGLGWVDRVTWKGKLNQPGGEFLGVLRGPTAGEPDFAARARRELEACLLDLISVARFRL